MNNVDLFLVTKDLTQWCLGSFISIEIVLYIFLYAHTWTCNEYIHLCTHLILKVPDHMVEVSSVSQWGKVGNWKSEKSMFLAGGPWGKERRTSTVQSSWGWSVVTILLGVQNCKDTLEIWILMCVLLIYKSWLSVIKYWEESKTSLLCGQIWPLGPYFITFDIDLLIKFSNKDNNGL